MAVLECLHVEIVLVPEGAVEARAIHPGGGGEIVEGCRRKTRRPERLDGLRQSDVRHIGGRTPASFWLFLYHFAKKIR